MLSVPLIFCLTRKYSSTISGLAAALTYTFIPVVLAADRNNTIDGMLVFTLLLAAWAFVRAAESGRFSHLLLASVLVGLAFNIKMLQAYLPLPAFFVLYFLASKLKWNKKLANLALSGLIILAISFSWALVVDLTPASQRPYVGSSDNNTETELIIGYNGLARLFGRGRDSNAPFGSNGGGPGAGGAPAQGQPPANGMGDQPAGPLPGGEDAMTDDSGRSFNRERSGSHGPARKSARFYGWRCARSTGRATGRAG